MGLSFRHRGFLTVGSFSAEAFRHEDAADEPNTIKPNPSKDADFCPNSSFQTGNPDQGFCGAQFSRLLVRPEVWGFLKLRLHMISAPISGFSLRN